MPDLSGIFGQPFPEQLAAWRRRLGELRPTATWTDVEPEFHDRGFMVAGATKADLLADLAGAVDKAISQGRSLEEFRRDFRDIVQKNGWHGWTGEGSVRGEAWRTRVIYRTNIATTYAAGRRAQLLEGNFAYWVYLHGGSREPRIMHLALNGVALPPDHPFWQTHSPPNGWGCSCYVIGARTAAGVRRLGGDPDKPLPPGWDAIDPKTGTPKGIDKGWAYAPGATVSDTVSALARRLEELPAQPSIDLIRDWIRSDGFEAWWKNPLGDFPLARLPDADAIAIGSAERVAWLSPTTLAKQRSRHPELAPAEYAMAQEAVGRGQTRVTDRDPESGALSRIFILEEASDATGGYVLVVKATLSGKRMFVTSFRRLSREDATRDAEIARLLGRAARRNPGEL